ncbi:MAG: hypothetical protein AAF702_28135 [Chloroflexota bacterium]
MSKQDFAQQISEAFEFPLWERFVREGKIYPITRDLLRYLLMDMPMTPAMIADFGVETADHYRLLREAMFYAQDPEHDAIEPNSLSEEKIDELFEESMERRAIELNSAIRRSSKLNAFVRKYVPALYPHVRFETGYDEGFQDWLETGDIEKI